MFYDKEENTIYCKREEAQKVFDFLKGLQNGYAIGVRVLDFGDVRSKVSNFISFFKMKKSDKIKLIPLSRNALDKEDIDSLVQWLSNSNKHEEEIE